MQYEERFSKMQQHTGEHIVSGIVNRRFGYNNVGFHLGNEEVTMDFDGMLTETDLKEIEWEANQAVADNVKIQVLYPTKEEKAARIGYSLISNHAFVDGNKRIGTHAMLVFLAINGVTLFYEDEELITLILRTAAGDLDEPGFLAWLKAHVES